MMKIGIITINDNRNFGNRLQNYAVQRIMSNYGDVYNIASPFTSSTQKIKYLLWKYSFGFFEKIFKNRSFCNVYFWKFNEHMQYDQRDVGKIIEDYDLFVYGSDQIWNPNYGASKDFISPKTPVEKNMTLAASFGVSFIPDDFVESYTKGFGMFKHLSVREDAGAEIINKLSGRAATVLVDPTLCVDKAQWEKVECKPKNKIEKDYIFIYFLGELSEEKKKEIQEFADSRNAIIIDILRDKSWKNVGPAEFIYLIHHASCVISDSFHASVFSIIFHTDFIVYARQGEQKGMESRIETLLKKFNLESQMVNSIKEFTGNIDYSIVDDVIRAEQDKVQKYIEASIK